MVALLIGASPACLLQLDTEISCGDGYVDRRAGETCDPALPSSYLNACPASRPAGVAACDPDTCQIINTIEQCGACGDGHIDFNDAREEECDGDNLGGERCPTSDDAVQCTSECKWDYSKCPLCGNGHLDGEEECDPGTGEGTLDSLGSDPRPCAGTPSVDGEPGLAPLLHPATGDAYTSGTVTQCLDTCTWDRVGCGFCGNDKLDKGLSIEGHAIPDEWCDGSSFDLTKIAEQHDGCEGENERVNVGCEDNCRGFEPRFESGNCCITAGGDCPPEGSLVRCCIEHEGAEEDAICGPVVDGVELSYRCN